MVFSKTVVFHQNFKSTLYPNRALAVLNVMPTLFSFKLLGASRRKDATDEVRKLIYQTILAISNNGRLGKRVTREVASQFGFYIRTV